MIRTLVALIVALIAGAVVAGAAVAATIVPAADSTLVPHTAAEVQACFDYADGMDGEAAYEACTTDAAAYEAWKVEYYRAR